MDLLCNGKILRSFWLLSMLFCVAQQDMGFVDMVTQNYNERVDSQLQQQILSYNNQELAYKAYATYYDRADVDLPGFKKFFKELSQRAGENAKKITGHINARGGRVRYPVVQLKDACSYINRALQDMDVTKPLSKSTVTVAARVKPHICYFQSLNSDPYSSLKKKKKTAVYSKYFSWLGISDKKASQTKETKREDWPSGLYGLEDSLAMEKFINDELISLLGTATHFRDPHTRHTLEDYLVGQVDAIKAIGDLVTRLRKYQEDKDYPLGEYLLDRELDEA